MYFCQLENVWPTNKFVSSQLCCLDTVSPTVLSYNMPSHEVQVQINTIALRKAIKLYEFHV